MKKKSSSFLRWLCFFLFVWATTATVLLIKGTDVLSPTIKKNLPLELETQTTKSVRLLENVGFLRQFLEQFFTYNSSNFWQTQTALAFSMGMELRETRLSEIERLRPKLANKEYAQKSRLLSLSQLGNSQYKAILEIQMSDTGKEHLFFIEALVTLNEVQRSVENPWGREVTALNLKTETNNPLGSKAGPALLAIESPLLLSFNCAVENIRLAKDSPIIAKMTTMNVSEIQILSQITVPEIGAKIGANCKDQSFEIELVASSTETTVFLDIGKRFLKQTPLGSAKKKKNPYQKTLEDQLDFIMEE